MSSSRVPAAIAVVSGSLSRLIERTEPHREQNVREALSLDFQTVGSVSQFTELVGKCTKDRYGAPDCLRHSMQWQLTSLVGDFEVLYWMYLQAQLPEAIFDAFDTDDDDYDGYGGGDDDDGIWVVTLIIFILQLT